MVLLETESAWAKPRSWNPLLRVEGLGLTQCPKLFEQGFGDFTIIRIYLLELLELLQWDNVKAFTYSLARFIGSAYNSITRI